LRRRELATPAREAAENEMPDQSFDAEAYLDAAAALLGLPIDPAHRPGVLLNLQRLAEMAALVMEFPLPDEIEPAPVFTP
jgi:hypothetical protein